MNGIELSKAFWDEYAGTVLDGLPADVLARVAAGLAGQGSECFGFDDALSRDHDFEPGFRLWLDDSDYERWGMELQRRYNALPRDFCGVKRLGSNAYGGLRNGVMRAGDFYGNLLGVRGVPADLREWLEIPEYALATAVNGQVFKEGGTFSETRAALLNGYPRDVLLKKLAARCVTMAQAGQYNFPRSLKRGDCAAAAEALGEFVGAACSAIYLLNNAYMPYYKWRLRGLENLPTLGDMREPLSFLLTEETSAATADVKTGVAEDVCRLVADELRRRHLSDESDSYLEPHGFAVNGKIENAELRALHILAG